jgi:hypothetical protein
MKKLLIVVLSIYFMSCSNEESNPCSDIEIDSESLFNCSPYCSNCEPDTEYYFKAEINGTPLLIELDESSVFGNRLINFSLGTQCKGSFTSAILNFIEGTSLTISLYYIAYLDAPCDESDFNEVFLSRLTPGKYKFDFVNDDEPTVGISFTEENYDESWNSIFGPNNDLTMTILSNEDMGLDSVGRKQNKVTGEFNSCYLFNGSSSDSQFRGDSVLVSNAKFSYLFRTEIED